LVDKIQMRDDRWVIPDLVGKRKKVRLVPIPGWVKDRLDLWTVAAKITEGKIFSGGGQERHGVGSLAQHDGGLEDRVALRARGRRRATWRPTI
jgi:hypothetical protein